MLLNCPCGRDMYRTVSLSLYVFVKHHQSDNSSNTADCQGPRALSSVIPTPLTFPSQLIKNRNLFHKAFLSVLSWAGCGEKKRRKEEMRKMEKKVVNVTEPWKAWPGVGMIRYTRFFSAVAAGINITYISPSLVQEISSPGTYNLNTLTALWFTHTHTPHTVRSRPFQVAHVHTHIHTHTRGQTRVLNSIFYSVCKHDSGCYYLFTHTYRV